MLQATAIEATNRLTAFGHPWAASREEARNDLAELPSHPLPTASRTAQVLIIGENLGRLAPAWRGALAGLLHQLTFAATGAAGLDQARCQEPDVILLDLYLPDQAGLEVQQQLRRLRPLVPVICVAPDSRAGGLIEAMKQGAFDCLVQPLHLAELRRAVGDALDVARHPRPTAPTEETAPGPDGDGLVGCCPAMGEVYKAIGRVAGQNVPVLITGESGTGKELLARALHAHSARSEAPFLALNCAAIPDNLLESELLGHEKGAFTGADRKRLGKFEQCNGGTLLLDEVGDMPLALQAKVLRLLQEQTFERVGGNETVRTDVRLIASTHRDLRAWSGEGKFRPDLYYRLGVFTIHLPPLRERGDDLPLLVQHYVRRFGREMGREVQHVAPEAMDRLRGYGWPGNVRELQSVLRQALLQASGGVLLPGFLPKSLGRPGTRASAAPVQGEAEAETFVVQSRIGLETCNVYAEAHRQVDRVLLPRILESTRGNQHQAARRLGIARQTLRQKLRDLGLHVTCSVGTDEDDRA